MLPDFGVSVLETEAFVFVHDRSELFADSGSQHRELEADFLLDVATI